MDRERRSPNVARRAAVTSREGLWEPPEGGRLEGPSIGGTRPIANPPYRGAVIPNSPFAEVFRPAPSERRNGGRATFARLEYRAGGGPPPSSLVPRAGPRRSARIAHGLSAAFLALARLWR